MRIVPIAVVFLLAVACDKQSKAPRASEATSQKPARKGGFKVSVPKEIPAAFKAVIETNWPLVQAAGKSLDENFKRASAAKNAGDRAAMDAAIAAGRNDNRSLQDKWAEVAYWPENNLEDDEKLQEKCRRLVSKYERKVQKWTKKAKGLKEFSRVK